MNLRQGLVGLLMLPMAITSPQYDTKVDLRVSNGSFSGIINPDSTYKFWGRKLEQPRLEGTYSGDTIDVKVVLPMQRDHRIKFISPVVAEQAQQYAGQQLFVYFTHSSKDSTVIGKASSPIGFVEGSFNVRYHTDETLTGQARIQRQYARPESLQVTARFIPIKQD